MGNDIDKIPVISQVKSAAQAIGGDAEGARRTQERFVNTAPVISQTKSAIQAISGDCDGAKRTQQQFYNESYLTKPAKTVIDTAKATPAIIDSFSNGDEYKGDFAFMHFDKDGVSFKPQWKYGVSNNNASIGGGIDDVRDGISVGAAASVYETFEARGNTLFDTMANLKVKANGIGNHLPGVQEILKIQQQRSKLVRDVANKIGINVQVLGTWFEIEAKISASAGMSGAIQLGWENTDGYYMYGVFGEVAAAMEFDIGIAAGMHKNGSSVKIVIDAPHCTLTIKAHIRK